MLPEVSLPKTDTLNDAQRRAVNHLEGPLLILAGPGSGNTRVITHRIARLIRRGVEPGQILAVTFTNKAAKEMRERVRKLLGRGVKGLTIKTFHAACVGILREEIGTLGYGKNFIIYDQQNQTSLMRTILREIDGSGGSRSANDVLDKIGAMKHESPGSAELEQTTDPETEADHAGQVAVALRQIDRRRRRSFAKEILSPLLQAIAIVCPGIPGLEVFEGIAAHIHGVFL